MEYQFFIQKDDIITQMLRFVEVKCYEKKCEYFSINKIVELYF